MPTNHAGPLKSTLHECNCSSCLTLQLYLFLNLYLYLYFSSSGRACRAGSGCIHPTYFVPNSSLPQTLPFFLSASSFSAITSSTSLFKILHLTFQFWWNMLFCYFFSRTFFVQCQLPCFDFCCNLCSQATNLMTFKFIL